MQLDCGRPFVKSGYNEKPSCGFNILYFWPENSNSIWLTHLLAINNNETKGVSPELTCFITVD